MNKLFYVFKSIEKDEVQPLLLLFLHSFLNGLSLTFFETTANTLFLMKYDTSQLPYVYIITAIVSVIAGFYYSKLENKLSIQKLLKITLLFVLSIFIIFLVLIKFSDSKLAFMGIMVFKDMMWMFVGLEFGILSSFLFNIRQGKRLFGLLMSGEIFAGIIGGFSIGILLDYIETINLLFISSITLMASFLLLLKILNKFSSKFNIEKPLYEESKENDISYSTLLKNRYFILFFTISVLAFFIFYFIDYVFYFKVEEKFTNEKELASFFGMFFALLNIVNLFSSLFISGAMLSRFGVAFGLLAIPILALVGTSSLVITAMLSLGVGFVVLLVLKLLNEVLDITILNPSFKLLNQAIASHQRTKVLAFRETIIEPISMGVAGVFLLVLAKFGDLSIVYYLIIFMAVIWLILGKRLKEEYVKSLEKLLMKREVFSDDLLLSELDENFILNGLESENDVEILYCLNALVTMNYEQINEILSKLSTHKSDVIRLRVIEYIGQKELKDFVTVLEDRIEIENNPAIINKLLRTYCQLATYKSIERVSKFIDNNNVIIKEGAIVGMLEHTGVDGILIAGSALNNLFESDKKEDRIIALNILKQMKVPSFYKAIEESLQSTELDIKTISITVVGNLKIEKFLPNLFKTLGTDEYRNESIKALIKFGDSILKLLIEYFNASENLNTKFGLIKVISSYKTEQSNEFLLEKINEPLLHDIILEKLFETNFISSNQKLIKFLLTNNVREILENLIILDVFDKINYPNSYQVLEELSTKKISNLFLIMAYAYPKEILLQCKYNYNSQSKDRKAYAVEMLDNIVSTEIKKIVLPMLDDLSLSKKILSYPSEFVEKMIEDTDFFKNTLEDDMSYPILKISILYEMGKNRCSDYFHLIQNLSQDKNITIQETALWTLSQLKQR
ncbi:transporter, Major Facilitator superfamily [Sulfurimonas gotlandica GD1]|uniref:Transporter, Major Facilitator superfamily n=1 Tax=Sulfurimonas gotlandica (strain DSM 19862 / JCM 16533 / GD1) TaxID=929558 RepID=B6BHK2_SULGG|nr:MFS transporter [Sulfurimonas gotlandica]EDZ63576.1 conserved hypothetical protein [Sulfurimonas gotlandica GD1]EHP30000.1 transporter, Major Facilitator superfamily [Sulfurimonas gotlandica GD1]